MNIENEPKFSVNQVEEFFRAHLAGETESSAQSILAHADAVLRYLDQGRIRVWIPETNTVQVWAKLAILEYFKLAETVPMDSGVFQYYDKMPVKSLNSLKGVRVIPGAIARFGSFIEAGAILMPSFVNIGAHVGTGTMVDTWATVGSCAQIGKNVHLSGGVGIGGVLEPAQALPVIVEDGAFLGSRAIVVEGVRIGKEAVLGAGVCLTASTKIVDVRGEKPEITQGYIPPSSVAIPGTMPKQFAAGEFGVPCVLIIGSRTQSTNLKTSLNDALRNHQVAV